MKFKALIATSLLMTTGMSALANVNYAGVCIKNGLGDCDGAHTVNVALSQGASGTVLQFEQTFPKTASIGDTLTCKVTGNGAWKTDYVIGFAGGASASVMKLQNLGDTFQLTKYKLGNSVARFMIESSINATFPHDIQIGGKKYSLSDEATITCVASK